MSSMVDTSEDWMTDINERHLTGTTIMAVEYDGGVVIGADSRATTGAYVANRVSDKLTKITDRIYCCRSGSSSDTQAIADFVQYSLEFHEMQTGEEPLVRSAANVFRDLCYQYRDRWTAGIIVAGWDKVHGPQVYSIPIGGMIIRMPITIGGSGSSYIYGFCDAEYKEGMSKEKVVEFVTKALALAMGRDGSSGGVARIGIITEQGIERRIFKGNDLPKFNAIA